MGLLDVSESEVKLPWETVSGFHPPSPMMVWSWTRGADGLTPENPALPVFAMLIQRCAGSTATRVVAGVMNRHGAVTAVEPTPTFTEFALVVSADRKGLSDEEREIFDAWWRREPPSQT